MLNHKNKFSKKIFSLIFAAIQMQFTGTFVFAQENIAFEILRFSLTGNCDSNYISEPVEIPGLEMFFNRSYYDLEKHCFNSFIEKYFPGSSIVLEAAAFYSESTDTGDWVDYVLFELEEERLAQQIEALNQEGQNLSGDFFANLDEDSNPETVFAQNDSTLSSMEFDDEVLVVEKNEDSFVRISSNSKTTLREYYDLSYRLFKKENWNISSVANSSLISTEEYFYKEDGIKPYGKAITSENLKETFDYTETGLVEAYKKYVQLEKTSKILEEQNWTYDEEKRVTSQIKKTYTYNDEEYKKLKDVFEQKHNFTYNEWENIPPDEEYYEDDVLKQKTKYSKTEGTYTSQIFFDNNFSVKTYFRENQKYREVYTLNGEVWRVKEYEIK